MAAFTLPATSLLRCLPKPSTQALARAFHGRPQPAASRVSSSFSPVAARSSNPLRLAARRAFSSGSSSSSSTGARSSASSWASSAGVAAMAAIGFAHLRTGPIYCDSTPVPPPPPTAPVDEPKSIINPYELGFGAVCGICAGVFVKKGAKLLAFVLGGVFVLLQYLNSLNIVKVNWSKIGARYTSATSQPNGAGGSTALTVKRAFNWVVDFLTRDFQQRATFIGGFTLGLRLG